MATDTDAEADAATDGDPPEAYEDLLDQYHRVSAVGDAQGLLSWDQQVMMPEGGTPARSRQLSTLSGIEHDLLVGDDLADPLSELEGAALAPERAAAVREIRREHERAARVPRPLIEEVSAAASEAIEAWEAAREADDFDAFAPHLERLVELKREYAAEIDPDRDPYAVLFEEYEPCLPLEHAERILTRLREAIVPMLATVRSDGAAVAADAFPGTFDADAQEALSRDALSTLGYDWERGRLDTSSHPFTSGTQFDARITTRFDEADPLGALTATVHEFGHAAYEQGLPREAYGTPLGEARDLSVHESQSRLWENHVGRSRAFWERFLPTVREHFPDVDATPEAAYEAANRVREDNLIRVEADELTYHLHVVVRYEIERDLVRGDLDVAEVPAVWNDAYEEYLGLRPETDADGCLQDIHWSYGNFGYFPTYSLGSAMAAQLFAAAEADLGPLEDRVRDGEFGPLHGWLGEHVHRHGKRYETGDLVRQATGEAFTADHFLEYAAEKYGDLYDLDLATHV